MKAADSSINRRDELWRASDSDAFRTGEIGTVCRFASADSLRMGDGPVAGDRVNRLAPEAGASLQSRSSPERCAASGTRVAAMRVAMVLDVGARLGVIAQVAAGMDSKPPATLYEGAAHAERGSRPTAPPPIPVSYTHLRAHET